MTENDTGDKIAEAGAELLGKLLDSGSRLGEGIFSSPWTGVPAFVAILLSLETTFPGITARYWSTLTSLLSMVGAVLGNALAQFGTGVTKSVGDILKDLGASPTAQPPPPPPLPSTATHAWFAHTTGATAFQIGAGDKAFSTAAARDQWVRDNNGSFYVHLIGNFVNETWDQDVDGKGNPIGPRQNDVAIPPPNPWVIAGF